jgi:cytochrome o ubiquinol oxidase subunit 3
MSEHKDNSIFGFWIYLMSDCVLFASLFATFVVLQNATFGGAELYDLANLRFVFVETLLLLTSSFTVGLALLAGHAGKKKISFTLLLATLILGLSFLSMELWEFFHLIAEGNGPDRSAFLSAFFALVGTHGLHVFFGSLWMVILMYRIGKYGLTHSNVRKLTMLSLFWHFLDVIWIFIFTFVYLFGALAL